MLRAMTGVSEPFMETLLDGFEGVGTLVDVGGSSSACLEMIMRPVPTIREGINFDLPDVVAAVPPIAGVKHVGGDMFKSIPSGDAIFMKVDCLRKHVTKCGLGKKIELVIVSPLMRTLQTAVGVFGGENCTDGASASPLLMVEGAGCSGGQAISSLNYPPFLAVEACRERLGVHPCNKRSSITEYCALFPATDFSLIDDDEDALWEPDVREAIDAVATRGMKFIDLKETNVDSCY